MPVRGRRRALARPAESLKRSADHLRDRLKRPAAAADEPGEVLKPAVPPRGVADGMPPLERGHQRPAGGVELDVSRLDPNPRRGLVPAGKPANVAERLLA